jgi:hypothetical protein
MADAKKRATEWGVEGFPLSGCPLDPEPGLGGTNSVGLFSTKSRDIFHINSMLFIGQIIDPGSLQQAALQSPFPH